MHERFHLDNMFNSDIALLKTTKKIKLGKNVGGICLPTKTFEEPRTKEYIIVGWGQLSFESKMQFPEILQEVSLKNVDLIHCSKKYRQKKTVIYRSQFCTWKEGKDACQVSCLTNSYFPNAQDNLLIEHRVILGQQLWRGEV